MTNRLKVGTHIEVIGFDMNWNKTYEPAVIARPTKVSLPLPGDGWYVIRYADGGKMCAHKDRFRVVSNA